MRPSFGLSAEDYRRHRAGFPDSLFERLRPFRVGLPGQVVVDLGTGTGTLARGFARRGCRAIGIDPDPRMLAQARELDAEAGVEVEYREARAERTELPDGVADVVAAGQCWHWFDRAAAVREVARILRCDGAVLIAHFDWIPLEGNVAHATEERIRAHNPEWKLGGGLGLYPPWLRDLAEGGFADIESFSYDVDVPYSHEAWRGRIRASAGVGATLSADRVAAFDRDLARLLEERFPGEPLRVPHRVFAVVARSAGSARARREPTPPDHGELRDAHERSGL